jgi:hypothetical protein
LRISAIALQVRQDRIGLLNDVLDIEAERLATA